VIELFIITSIGTVPTNIHYVLISDKLFCIKVYFS